MPGWFNEAKFGIFVVWGPYSVPAWKDRGYAEWYGHNMNRENSPTWKFHRRAYGKDFRYEQFAPMFKAELWDPDAWCDLFARAGTGEVGRAVIASTLTTICVFVPIVFVEGVAAQLFRDRG